MKKTILVLLALALAVILCGCEGVTITIDGLEDDTPQEYAFGLSCENDGGNAFSEFVDGYYPAGTEITARVVTEEDTAFYCWTIGGYLADGGVPISYEKELSFPLDQDVWLFANFRDHDSALVLYHANGGEVLQSSEAPVNAGSAPAEAASGTTAETEPPAAPEGDDLYWDDFSLAYYLYPNALADVGYFRRDGYTLIGYSTEPEGEGEFYNVGGKVFEDTDAVIELWCVWSEQSPVSDFTFEYNRSYSGWTVTAYNGADEAVSIPSEYDGEPVIGVAAGAFTDCDTVKSLVFPSSLRLLQDFAVNSCDNLETIWLFDSLDYVSDDTFDGDTSLNTVYFGAATLPVYSNWFNNHTKKIEIMNYWKDSQRPKMIILGGSSTTYAVDSEQLESLLDRDYLVLNCGTNGANLFNMTSEWAMRFLHEDDFLLQIIEYSAWQLGGVICRWESWRSFESCYNVFSWVNASQYYDFFDSFCDYLDARKAQNPSTYEDYVSNLAPGGYYNDHGTLNVVTRANGSDTFWQGRNIYFCDYWMYDFMVYYCNAQYAKLRDMGVDYAMAFTPLNRNSLYDYQTDQAIDDFEYYLDMVLDIPILGHLRDAIWEPAEMFDDDYHLAAPARAEYTEALAGYLNDYFADPAAYDNELMPNGFTTEANIAAAEAALAAAETEAPAGTDAPEADDAAA